MKSKAQKRIRILLVQIVNHNLGDAVIADNTEYLLKKAMRKAGIHHGTILRHDIASGGLAPLPYVQAIVFAGGGLIKFRQEHFYENVIDICQEANRLQIPVFFNAVGVEGYDRSDERCAALEDAISLPWVKGFSCRDDLDTLQNHYLIGCYKQLSAVMDPAIFCGDTYKKVLTKADRQTIGLGITRHRLFGNYGTEGIDHDYLLDYWAGIVALLEKQGQSWELFTNGRTSDEAFAREVLAYIGHGALAPQPAEPAQLVERINGYKGIIAGRMHSNIIAYALGVPSVGFVWNPKIQFWGERIGMPERFLTAAEMTPERTVNVLQAALREGCPEVPKEEKQKLLQELTVFLKKWAQPDAERVTLPESLSTHMVATALGGTHLQYENMNTPATIATSLEQGFRTLEVDLRLTADRKLVCVNGWNKGTYKRLGLSITEEGTPALTEEAFLQQSYYHCYPTSNFEAMVSTLQEQIHRQSIKEVRLILDICLPKAEEMEQILEQLRAIVPDPKVRELVIHYAIRLQRKKDVEAYLASGLPFEIIYYLPEPKDDSEEEQKKVENAIRLCKQKKIKLISMNAELWNENTAALIKDNGLEAVVFSYAKAGNLMQALDLGARYVGSRYLTPAYMDALLQ